MVVVHQGFSVNLLSLRIITQVDMYLRTRAAGAGIAHLPEIIFLRTEKYAFFRQYLLPIIVCFLVGCQLFTFITTENAGIQPFRIQFKYLCQQFPAPGNGFFLEIIPKGPVAQHLKHGMVVSIMSHFFKVVVFT